MDRTMSSVNRAAPSRNLPYPEEKGAAVCKPLLLDEVAIAMSLNNDKLHNLYVKLLDITERIIGKLPVRPESCALNPETTTMLDSLNNKVKITYEHILDLEHVVSHLQEL